MTFPDSCLRDDGLPPEPTPRAELFLRYFAEHHERLLAHIFGLLPREQDARDVFQKTSLVLWRKFDQFREDGDFLAWACGIAYFEVRNFYRMAGRDRLRFSDELLQTLSDERQQRSHQHDRRAGLLAECIKRLSPRERELIHEVYNVGNSVKELADQIGRAAQTIYNRLNLVRRKLLLCVERRLAEQGD